MKTCNERQIKHRQKFKKLFGQTKWAAQNGITIVSALNNGKPWEDKDDIYLISSGDKVIDKAIKLGRTKFSVEQRIKKLNKFD